MAGGSFLGILRISGFLFCVWSVGKAAKWIGVSSIVFEITIGLILSPSMLGLMPEPYSECHAKMHYTCSEEAAERSIPTHHSDLYEMMHHLQEASEQLSWGLVIGEHGDHGGCQHEYDHFKDATKQLSDVETAAWRLSATGNRLDFSCSGLSTADAQKYCRELTTCIADSCKKDVEHECQIQPNFFTLVGHTGVSMMIFESGMHFDFERAKVVGVKACAVAVLGTCLPLIAGFLIVVYLLDENLENGLAAGVSLAPTSVGIALKLLLEAKQLQKDFGQAIITAAFVDDILSLVAFNVLFSATSGKFSFVYAILPAIIGMLFLIGGAGLGISFWPYVVENILSRVPAKRTPSSMNRQDEALLLLMFFLLVSYGTFTFILGTHLWGCFVAGMSFAMIHHAHHVWVRQVKRITVWMIRVFFSCTVAFAIPWKDLLSPESFLWGSLMGVTACIFTKVICAFFMGECRFVIGWAMVGRAEFAYLIAEMAKSAGIMNPRVFSIVIWSLLYATIFAPFCFRKVLQRYSLRLAEREAEQQKELEKQAGDPAEPKRNSSGSIVPSSQLEFAESAVFRQEFKTKNSQMGHSILDGHKWFPSRLTAFRFQIIYNLNATGNIACNMEDLSEIWLLLRKMGLVVTSMEQKCDLDTRFSTFTIQSEDGKVLEASELTFVQEEIFKEMRGLGAYIVFLPPMHALQDTCKLAKVTVIAHMSDRRGMAGVTAVIDEVIRKDFYVMRAGLELHGESLVFEILVGHVKSEAAYDEPDSPPIRRSSRGNRPPVVSGVSDSFEDPFDDGVVTKAEFGAENLHVGAKVLPDITPDELNDMKLRVEKVLKTRVCVVVDPLTYGQGPTGDVNHDAHTLMMALPKMPTAEIRFTVQSMQKDLFARVMRVISKPGIQLVSARVDERAACQINVVISCEQLTKQMEDNLMDELAEVAEAIGVQGHIDLANLNTPLAKIYRDIGSEVQSPRSAANRSSRNIGVNSRTMQDFVQGSAQLDPDDKVAMLEKQLERAKKDASKQEDGAPVIGV